MSRPWMPFWVGDYLKKTSHLNAQQHGAYLLLILHYWEHGGLPNDDLQLARISRLTQKQWMLNRNLLSPFFDSEWRHFRIDEELEKAENLKNIRSYAGSKGSSNKWKNLQENKFNRSTRMSLAKQKGTHTIAQWVKMLEICYNTCLKCGKKEDIVKDHVVPIYQGGDDSIFNLQPLCRSCNASKGPDNKDHRPNGWQNAYQNDLQTPVYSPSQSFNKSSIKERIGNFGDFPIKLASEEWYAWDKYLKKTLGKAMMWDGMLMATQWPPDHKNASVTV